MKSGKAGPFDVLVTVAISFGYTDPKYVADPSVVRRQYNFVMKNRRKTARRYFAGATYWIHTYPRYTMAGCQVIPYRDWVKLGKLMGWDR